MPSKKTCTVTPVKIAKDVLKWLSMGKKSPLRVKRFNVSLVAHILGRTDLQVYLKSGGKCEVCARGALVAAKAWAVDQIEVTRGGYMSRQETTNALATEFSGANLDEIEIAFEDSVGLRRLYLGAVGRLREICENIIVNKGKFVPYVRPERG